jgi:hypothetical protein
MRVERLLRVEDEGAHGAIGVLREATGTIEGVERLTRQVGGLIESWRSTGRCEHENVALETNYRPRAELSACFVGPRMQVGLKIVRKIRRKRRCGFGTARR